LLASEKKSLYRFLAIYLISTFILFSLAVGIFYKSAKNHIVNSQKKELNIEAQKIKSSLQELHQSSSKSLIYPRSKESNSAIFDLDKKLIFSTFAKTPMPINQIKDGKIYKLYNIKPYYLGAAYLLIAKDINNKPIHLLQKNITIFMVVGGLFFLILGIYLGKLFIKPMRELIQEKNRFIQDATHELNTPISTILTNIELIEALNKCQDAKDELKRVEIASKTLSRIYEDLTYINFNSKAYKSLENINFSNLVKERILYFDSFLDAKNIKLQSNIADDVFLNIDKNDAIRLVDNILSNAIKYNNQNGSISIVLTSNTLSIEDSGIGIEKYNLNKLTKRFLRANNSEGGFGLGLNIVDTIAKSYNLKLDIQSQEKIGTKVTISW
jgi:two-component system OmpR family sensor kinase